VFAFADLVLRHLHAELPTTSITLLRVVDFSARIEVAEPVRLRPGGVLELDAPGVLRLPRTQRAIDALLESAVRPRPDMVPFVSAVSDCSVTLAPATRTATVLGRTGAWRAAEMHWLAPWRRRVRSVGVPASGPPCQCTYEEASATAARERASATGPSATTSFLVVAGATDEVDLERLSSAGGRVGVLRYVDADHPTPVEPGSTLFRPEPASVGEVEYVLVDELP
jgi:hypothetical protein